MSELTILISCPDKVGLVTNITRVLAAHQLNIVAMREFVDEEKKGFFTRIACTGDLEAPHKLKEKLLESLPNSAEVNLINHSEKQIAVLVTKEYHCLAEILVKNQFKTLGANVKCVIGNYEGLKDFAGKIINIHHSFLPAFIGANPYKQAFERGVKIIGATAHFVTDNLDEGPIITQHTTHIDHNFGVKEMVRAGKEIEKKVLLEALELIFENRVFVSGNKTIVFK